MLRRAAAALRRAAVPLRRAAVALEGGGSAAEGGGGAAEGSEGAAERDDGAIERGGTVAPPAAEDPGRAALSLIIGFPRRVTTTSSPADTWSSQYPRDTRNASAPIVTAACGEFEWS
jgi:hypothetical protein